jgi:hypothetical protein
LRIASPTLQVSFPAFAPISSVRQVKTLPKTPSMGLEAQLIETQARFQRLSSGGDVSGTATLVRLGPFEVRLLQPLSVPSAGPARFWLELFDHDRQFSIDSVGDCDIANAMIVADEFIDRATKLSQNPHSWRRTT